MYLFVAWLGCLFPEIAEAVAIGWFLLVVARLT